MFGTNWIIYSLPNVKPSLSKLIIIFSLTSFEVKWITKVPILTISNLDTYLSCFRICSLK